MQLQTLGQKTEKVLFSSKWEDMSLDLSQQIYSTVTRAKTNAVVTRI